MLCAWEIPYCPLGAFAERLRQPGSQVALKITVLAEQDEGEKNLGGGRFRVVSAMARRRFKRLLQVQLLKGGHRRSYGDEAGRRCAGGGRRIAHA